MFDCLRLALRLSLTKLVCLYDGMLYEQLRGLAMGVAESPDVANLFGCHFEEKVNVMADERIPFYGRYIDDCFSIVRAQSCESARQYMADKIQFDGCQILWDASDLRCNFLDATFYWEANGDLAGRPYRKQNNHMERIPWISHHPLDVKRGTFTGEMSRLATLSSTFPVYMESVKALVSLYCKRGYPEDLCIAWVRKYLTERWEQRLRVSHDAAEDEGVLVLKSSYNTAWNWFNATELANIILGHWKRWHEICDAGHPGKGKIDVYEWPAPGPGPLGTGLSDCAPEFFTKYRTPRGDDIFVPDVRKIGMTDKRLIVSRKRTRNMFDYTSLWKKEVFAKLDEEILSERDDAPITDREAVETPINSHSAPSISNDPPPATNPAADDSDDENVIHLHRRDQRASPGLSRGYFG